MRKNSVRTVVLTVRGLGEWQMAVEADSLQKRYNLRYAGGIYWLLDCAQEGVPYKEPIPMNEVGARIWNLMTEGKTEAEIVACICAEYEADGDMVRQDVAQFVEQLSREKHG